jgi:hypothetical protein
VGEKIMLTTRGEDGVESTLEWKTQMMPGTGTGVVIKKRKGNHRFIMATLPSLASICSSSANNVELHLTFMHLRLIRQPKLHSGWRMMPWSDTSKD